MVAFRQSGARLKSDNVHFRGCCCIDQPCYYYEASKVCNANDFQEYYRDQISPIADRWQGYCLRGVVYRNRIVTVTGEGLSERAFYDFELDDYDECLALTGRFSQSDRVLPYDPDYAFGNTKDDPCIDLNPIINYESSIDWRCVERENILDGLAAIIPGHLRTVPHTVVIRVEYSRHVQGRFDGVFTFEAGNIHLLEMEAVAIFE